MSRAAVKEAEALAERLALLSNPLRLLMVCYLLKREMYALELLERLGTTKGNISQHLKELLAHRLIQSRREGNRIYYGIRDENLRELFRCLKTLYCRSLEVE